MPYRGKLSAGCANCVKRRIRCDRREEGCSQCRRKGLTCAGYRSEADRSMPAYLNQTTETMRNAGGRVLPLDAPDRAKRLCRTAETSEPRIVAFAAQDLDNFSLVYCNHRHIIPPGPLTVKNEKLLACMKALGLTSYSNVVRSSHLSAVAATYYQDALSHVNADLGSPDKAVEDSTLLSIFFLGCYEFVASTDLISLAEGWTRHVRGLCALISMRGYAQLATIEGRYLFLLACGFILRDHLRSGAPIPDCIEEMMNSIARIDGRWRPILLSLQFASLRARVMMGESKDLRAVILRARALDDELASCFSAAPTGWDIQLFDWPGGTAALLPTHMHTYETSAAAMMWNSVRGARINCHALVSDLLERHPSLCSSPELQVENEVSQIVIQCMQMDMLASVPHILIMSGVNPSDVMDSYSTGKDDVRKIWPGGDVTPNQDLARGKLPMLALTRGYALTFQLASAGRQAEPGTSVRGAFCKSLRILGRHLGFPIAFSFADALETDFSGYEGVCSRLPDY